MLSVVTDRVAWFVRLSVTLVSPVKTAERIEVPFGLWTWLGPWNHVLDGGSDPPMGRGNFGGKGRRGVAVTSLGVSTKLLYVGPG